MLEIIRFFSNNLIWIYLLLTVGLIIVLSKLIRDVREKRNQVFGLEIEITHRRVVQSVASLIIITLLMIGEFIIIVFLSPGIPSISLVTTPTINPLLVPQSTLMIGQGTETIQPPGSNSSQTKVIGCIPGQIMVKEPTGGQTITGKVTLVGTADIPNFGFYKYEYTSQENQTWSTILASRDPVIDGELGYWDTTELTPGDYQLRLVVTDNNGNDLPACIVPVRIMN